MVSRRLSACLWRCAVCILNGLFLLFLPVYLCTRNRVLLFFGLCICTHTQQVSHCSLSTYHTHSNGLSHLSINQAIFNSNLPHLVILYEMLLPILCRHDHWRYPSKYWTGGWGQGQMVYYHGLPRHCHPSVCMVIDMVCICIALRVEYIHLPGFVRMYVWLTELGCRAEQSMDEEPSRIALSPQIMQVG